MGIITVSIDDETERKLRKLARAMYGGKGHLGMAISKAVEEWAERKEEGSVSKSLAMLKKGTTLGGIISKKREDLHIR